MYSLAEPRCSPGSGPRGGIPLATALRAQGKEVHLANLAFSDLNRLDLDDWLFPGVARVRPGSAGDDA
ncbi:hypothetical protein VA596_25435 [Amycolatopsis sp., V23-08]|uniref:Uncharacterized protein n=1 Tax=Amycolatopsis heterodermiae TaxID=3110235 RepID=A0ABU5RCH1_9PSEU|nr:hypothetical protein [Amycolatopsis sp., V23-08]MEA5362901.1 hypothetical protein [Amycolatopsis sp., V23-08]